MRRELVTAPSDLRARKGSVESAGIAREDGATLLHWTESVTSTDADGRVRTAFTLKGAYGEQVAAPRAGACTQCGMQVAVVALESESIAIVRTAPDVTLAVLGTPPVSASFLAIHFRRDGSTSSEPLPWLATPQKAGGPVLAATLDAEGRIVVASDGKSWLADRSLRPLAGPVALPTSDARALFGANGDASIAWTISATEEGRSDDPLARREVFVANASVRERISVGRAVLGADRRDGELGFAFESAGRLFFAASSPSGQKRGGDLFVGTVGGRSSELGAFVPEDATTLAATSAGTFALATLGRGALTTTEIVCAP